VHASVGCGRVSATAVPDGRVEGTKRMNCGGEHEKDDRHEDSQGRCWNAAGEDGVSGLREGLCKGRRRVGFGMIRQQIESEKGMAARSTERARRAKDKKGRIWKEINKR